MATKTYDTSELAKQLYSVLASYLKGTPSDRDQLLEEHGYALVRLNRILHPLTRSRLEREHLIVAQQIFLERVGYLQENAPTVVNTPASCVTIET